MKIMLLALLMVSSPAFAQSVPPETAITGAQYRCETLAEGLLPDLVTFYQMFGLRHEGFALRLAPGTDDSVIWHLKSPEDIVGQEVPIRNRRLTCGETEHTAVIKPHHMVYESMTFHMLGQNKLTGEIGLEIRMDDDGSTVLSAKCRVESASP